MAHGDRSRALAAHPRNRQGERKPRAVPETGRLRPDATAVRFDDLTADGQTEPGAADAPMRRTLQAEELLEHLVEGVLGDAETAVFHADDQKTARHAC